MNETGQSIQKRTEVTEIDLVEVFHILWNKLWLLILCFVIGAGAAGGATKMFVTPQYQATSMIYVYTQDTGESLLQQLQAGTQITVDFEIIASTREVVEVVIDDLNLDTTYEELLSTITISNPSDSRVLEITVENPDPQLAAEISNSMANSLRERIAEVMSTDKPSTVQSAVVPSSPSSPNTMKNAMMGGLLCAVVAAGILLLRYFMDDTIQTEKDVERYLHLNTLAALPMERKNRKQSDDSKKGKRKKAKA